METDESKRAKRAMAIRNVILKFSSGNIIPVDRAIITKEEIEAIFGFEVGRTDVDIIDNPLLFK